MRHHDFTQSERKRARRRPTRVSFAPIETPRIIIPFGRTLDHDLEAEMETVVASLLNCPSELIHVANDPLCEREVKPEDLPSPRMQLIISLMIGSGALVLAGTLLLLSLWLNGYYVENSDLTSGATVDNGYSDNTENNFQVNTSRTSVGGNVPVPRTIPIPHLGHRHSTSNPTKPLLTLPNLTLAPHSFCTQSNASTTEFEASTSTTASSSSKPPNDVLITIITEPEDADVRHHYRQIWRHYLPIVHGDLMFALAHSQVPSVQSTIRAESDEFGDLLQIDVPTNPQAKYLKTLMALNWTSSNCPHVKFIVHMKVDVLVQPEALRVIIQEAIKRGRDTQPVIIGDIIEGDVDAGNLKFPKFVYGSLYLVSQAALQPLVEACRMVRPVSLEEVYVTGLCAEYGDIQRISAEDEYPPYQMERELKQWRKLFSCLPVDVLAVGNVGKDNVLYYWYKAVNSKCYL